jgi:hypothetical protein
MPRRISSFDHYIERSDDLKFEYLDEEKNAGNSKSKAFSGDFGRQRALPSTICNPYGLRWWKLPLGREGGSGEEVRRGGGEKIRDRTVFDRPPAVYIGWFYHPEYPDICLEYPDVRSIRTYVRNIRLPLSLRWISMRIGLNFDVRDLVM